MSDIGTYSFRRAQVDLDREEISRPSLSYWQDAWYRIRTNRRTLASLFIVVFMVLVAAFGPMLWHFDYDTQDLNQTSKPPWASRIDDRHRTVYAVGWTDRSLNDGAIQARQPTFKRSDSRRLNLSG